MADAGPGKSNTKTGANPSSQDTGVSVPKEKVPKGSSTGTVKPKEPKTQQAGAQEAGAQETVIQKAETKGNGTKVRTKEDAVKEGAKETAKVEVKVACGPLLNYRRMDGNDWFGSVLIVTRGGGRKQDFTPVLSIRRNDSTSNPEASGATSKSQEKMTVEGSRLYSDTGITFWSFPITCKMATTETKWKYSIKDGSGKGAVKLAEKNFFIPSENESMRIMFYSCNGFCEGTDQAAWNGPILWKNVMENHEKAPYHVMIGGGDQIYNDGVRGKDGPLYKWTNIKGSQERLKTLFTDSLRKKCDKWYLENYLSWYSTKPFSLANGQIPQLNIWDDHDIIDGFGSYTKECMTSPVFLGIGGVAHKYYMLFQHHLPPPQSTYTSPEPQSAAASETPVDKTKVKNIYVAPQDEAFDSSYILGAKRGPYIPEYSMSIYARLGARIAFVGLDARTERTIKEINSKETYAKIFSRVRKELSDAAGAGKGKRIKHLLLLLGVPIAYPRLEFLASIFGSGAMQAVKLANDTFGSGGEGFFNGFDGDVELLDDLRDHYTAKFHKEERRKLIKDLQDVCADHSVRITILSGDVHLAALGRFYSNPKHQIRVEDDHRYIVNVISSAIVNEPPPPMVAELLAFKNTIHKLHDDNEDTHETLMNLFNNNSLNAAMTTGINLCTMPSRNYATLTENSPNNTPVSTEDGVPGGGEEPPKSFKDKDGHSFLSRGEWGAGSKHKAASPTTHGKGNDGSLDCCIRVEINHEKTDAKTEGFGFTIPVLNYKGSLKKSKLFPQPPDVLDGTAKAAPAKPTPAKKTEKKVPATKASPAKKDPPTEK